MLNEDDHGERYLLFPQPLYDQDNPLPSETTHTLPGAIDGQESAWAVSSRGGHERFLVVASPSPVQELETSSEAAGRPAERRDSLRPRAGSNGRAAAWHRVVPPWRREIRRPGTRRRPLPPTRRSKGGVHGVRVRQIVLENPEANESDTCRIALLDDGSPTPGSTSGGDAGRESRRDHLDHPLRVAADTDDHRGTKPSTGSAAHEVESRARPWRPHAPESVRRARRTPAVTSSPDPVRSRCTTPRTPHRAPFHPRVPACHPARPSYARPASPPRRRDPAERVRISGVPCLVKEGLALRPIGVST